MTAYLDCPQFELCSVNDCPLADGFFQCLPEDPETECKARISTRQAIAKKYNLSNGGLTRREILREKRRQASKARWDALPEEEKQKRIANLKLGQNATKQVTKEAIWSGS